jgi:hypothetical protein
LLSCFEEKSFYLNRKSRPFVGNCWKAGSSLNHNSFWVEEADPLSSSGKERQAGLL